MKGFLELIKVAGIRIEVHWTFLLLLLWVGIIEYQNSGDFQRILIGQGFILVLMVCVVLHELGHALTARMFGIKTRNIILLPIGGVATLEKMPEKPQQELLVAFAGPAVNVFIAILLAFIVPINSYFNFDSVALQEILYKPTFQNFLFYLFLANVMLVVFNLIPAFPMDGGRVLRALLSFKLGRVEATKIASGIGQVLAVFFFIIGLMFNPFLLLIAFFIFFGAYGENQMVKRNSFMEGHSAREATLTNITLLSPENSIQDVIELLLAGTEKDFVVGGDTNIFGILTQMEIIKHVKTPSLLVGDVMDKTLHPIEASTELTRVLELMGSEKKNFFPVTEEGKLIGAIDRTNISEFILLQSTKT